MTGRARERRAEKASSGTESDETTSLKRTVPGDPDKMTRRLFIFGLGYSGLEIAQLAKAQRLDRGRHLHARAEKAASLRAAGHRGASCSTAPRRCSPQPSARPRMSSAPSRRARAGDPALRTLPTAAAAGAHGWAISRPPASMAITAAAGSTRRRRPTPGAAAQRRAAGDRAAPGRRLALETGAPARHLPAARHLRPRPQHDRPGEGRHRAAHRQARPVLLAHPCRGHRRHRR